MGSLAGGRAFHRFASAAHTPTETHPLGARSTAQATTSAYLSDVTSAGSRARVFSAVGGLMFGGFAFGPILGSLLIAHTDGNVLAPFYAALAVHVAYLLTMALVLPESLGEERRAAARERWLEERKVELEAERDEDARDRETLSLAQRSAKKVRRVLAKQLRFLRPVALLLPKPRIDASCVAEEDRTNIEWGAGMEVYEHPEEVWRRGEGKRGRDWGLTKIAMAYASYMMIIVRLFLRRVPEPVLPVLRAGADWIVLGPTSQAVMSVKLRASSPFSPVMVHNGH